MSSHLLIDADRGAIENVSRRHSAVTRNHGAKNVQENPAYLLRPVALERDPLRLCTNARSLDCHHGGKPHHENGRRRSHRHTYAMPTDKLSSVIGSALGLRENRQAGEMSPHVGLELLDRCVTPTWVLCHRFEDDCVQIAAQPTNELDRRATTRERAGCSGPLSYTGADMFALARG